MTSIGKSVGDTMIKNYVQKENVGALVLARAFSLQLICVVRTMQPRLFSSVKILLSVVSRF